MDWVQLHLVTNHFPIILIVAGTLAAIAAALSHRVGIWRYAFVTVVLAGLTAPVSYVSGLRAEEVVEDAWYVVHDQVEEHEETGLWALIALLAAGIMAAVAWWRSTPGLRWAFLIVAIVAAAVTAYSALEGGEIVHDSPFLERAPGGAGGLPTPRPETPQG
jgi:hypothetical protein